MVPIKEALTFDDVTLAPKYSEILPSEVNTEVELSKNLFLKIPLLSSAMDTVTEAKLIFKEVKVFKPKSSRKNSKESFIICKNLR